MWNLQRSNIDQQVDLIKSELDLYDVMLSADNSYKCRVGDSHVQSKSLKECITHIQSGIEEIREEMWKQWKDLADLAEEIVVNKSPNEGSLDNILFLSSVKKSFLLSKIFTDLSDITGVLKHLFDIDISQADPELVSRFNAKYLQIRLLHKLIVSEMYRIKLVQRYAFMSKQASISGPWANLDLPMRERVWEWAEGEEEYFGNRETARKEQVRYNPEYIKEGYFFVWQDLTRDPYKFEDIKKDSPYKSRHLMTIP